MAKNIFITGSDTGIGKTFYACQLLTALTNKGYRTAAMKPVASGAEHLEGELKNEDALALQAAMNVDIDYKSLNPYCFAPAIAPHIAAQQAGQLIDFSVIKREFDHIQSQADFTIIEGVGGWLVPMNQDQTVADLVLHLDIPVVLVVGIRLGCINHALLSAQVIQQSGAKLLGWIANIIDAEMPVINENIAAIQSRLAVPLLDTLTFQTTEKNSIPLQTNWLFD